MKAIVESKPLKAALAFLNKIAPAHRNKPVLGYCLMRAVGNTVTLSATDLEIYGKVEIQARVDDPGEVLLPITKVMKIITMALSVVSGDKKNVSIGEISLVTYDPAEMPRLLDAVSMTTLDRLAELVDSVKYATLTHKSNYAINGILLESDANTLSAVATDKHRLAYAYTDWTGPEFNHILPRKFADMLVAIKADRIGLFEVAGKKGVGAGNGKQTVLAFGVEGQFPKYGHLLKTDGKIIVKADTENLSNALAAMVGIGETDNVKLEIKKDKVLVYPLSEAASTGGMEVSAESNEEINIGVNAKFLIGGLREAGRTARITITNPLAPVVIERTDTGGWDFLSPAIQWKYILMPVELA